MAVVSNEDVKPFLNYFDNIKIEKEMIPKKIKVKKELFNKIKDLKPYEIKTKEEDILVKFLSIKIEQDDDIKNMFEFIYEEEE
jgi:hypothetical protein